MTVSLPHRARAVVDFLRAVYESWRRHRAVRLGAGLAYYGLVTLVPLAMIALAVAGVLFSESEIRSFVVEQLEVLLAGEIGEAISNLAASIDASSTIGSLTVLGVVSGFLGASIVFIAFQDALNTIWEIPVERGLRYTVRRRIVASLVVLLIGVLLAALLLFNAIVVLVAQFLPDILGVQGIVNDLFLSLTSCALGIAALAALFRVLVPKRLDWVAVIVASTITVLLLILGTWALGVYFDVWGSASISGVAGSILVVLLWLYYQAQIVVAGAELLKELDSRRQPATAA